MRTPYLTKPGTPSWIYVGTAVPANLAKGQALPDASTLLTVATSVATVAAVIAIVTVVYRAATESS